MIHRATLMFSLGLLTALAAPTLAASGGPVKSPAWAYEFGIANATLTSYDGATISLRRQVSPGAAWRLGFSSNLGTSSDEIDRTAVGSSVTAHETNDYSSHTHALSVTRLWFPAPETVVRPWLGLGLEASWSGTHRERTTVYRDGGGVVTSSANYVDDGKGPGLGLLGLFGLEWSASERFVLHAQYGQAVRWRRRSVTYDERQTYLSSPDVIVHSEGPETEWTIAGESARAGVSVFW